MNRLKTILTIVIFIGILLLGSSLIYQNEMYYTMSATVVEVDKDSILICDEVGMLYKFTGSNFEEDDTIVVKFYTNGTDDDRTDDKIVRCRKCQEKK